MNEAPVLDLESALARVENDSELYLDLVGIFLGDYLSNLSAIRNAASDGNSQQVERLAHSIKSSLGNIGGMRAFNAALRLEMAGKKGEKEQLSGLIQDLEAEIDSFIKAFHEYEAGA